MRLPNLILFRFCLSWPPDGVKQYFLKTFRRLQLEWVRSPYLGPYHAVHIINGPYQWYDIIYGPYNMDHTWNNIKSPKAKRWVLKCNQLEECLLHPLQAVLFGWNWLLEEVYFSISIFDVNGQLWMTVGSMFWHQRNEFKREIVRQSLNFWTVEWKYFRIRNKRSGHWVQWDNISSTADMLNGQQKSFWIKIDDLLPFIGGLRQ